MTKLLDEAAIHSYRDAGFHTEGSIAAGTLGAASLALMLLVFRPDYGRLAELPEAFPDARLSAFTATADAVTRQDIVERLFGGRARAFVAGFDRPNLQINIAPRTSAARQIDGLLDRHSGRSGIVYTLSRKKAERTAQRLFSNGRTALPYHAGMEQTVRDRHQDRFLAEDGVVMVLKFRGSK